MKYSLKQVSFYILLLTSFLINNVVADPPELSIDEYLDLPLSDLMEMDVTTVSRKKQKHFQSAAAIYVITNEDIRRSGVTTIADVLAMAPGIDVAKVSSSKWAVGGSVFTNTLLVQIDGRTVYSPGFSGVYWDVQDTIMEDIDRIEIIQGSGASLWGANAVTGIINIVTKKSAQTADTLISVGAGDEEKGFGYARVGKIFNERLAGRAYITYHDKDSYRLFTNGKDAEDNWRKKSAGFRVDGESSKGDKNWIIQGDWYRADENNQNFALGNSFAQPVIIADNPVRASGWNILGRWNRRFKSDEELQFQVYFDHTSRQEDFDQVHDTFDFDFQHQFNFNQSHDIVWGAGYRYVKDHFNSGQIKVIPDSQGTDLYNAFIHDEISLIPNKWTLILGTKLEHNDISGFEYQPNIRINWLIDDKQTFWAAISRSVRIPSRFERGGHTIVSFETPDSQPVLINIIGNEDLKSETSIDYEIGYRAQLTPNSLLDVSLYYRDIDNTVTLVEDTGNNLIPVMTASNELSGKSFGVLISANWQANKWWRLQANYGFNRTSIVANIDNLFGFSNEPVKTREQKFTLRSQMNIEKNIEFDIWGVFKIETPNTGVIAAFSGVDIEPYTRLNMRLAWKPTKNIELSLVGQNLLKDSQFEYSDELSSQLTEVERSVYAQVHWVFN